MIQITTGQQWSKLASEPLSQAIIVAIFMLSLVWYKANIMERSREIENTTK